jgi:hypothetical protein
MSTRTAQEQILAQFKDGKLLVDFRGKPQGNYATGGVTHRFNLLSRVVSVLRLQAEGTPYQLEACEYGTSNAIKIKFYDMSSVSISAAAEIANGLSITGIDIDVTVIGY